MIAYDQRVREARDDERRQTQQRMIAALYWRAGYWLMHEQRHHAKGSSGHMAADRCAHKADEVERLAFLLHRAMEAAL